MPEDSGQEKTEKATDKRRMEAREKGQVAKSQEISSVLVLLASLASFYYGGLIMIDKINDLMRGFFEKLPLGSFSISYTNSILRLVTIIFFQIVGPFFLVLITIAVLSNVMQTGILFNSEWTNPDFSKLNPISGFKNIFFSTRTIGEVVKGVLKISVISYVVYGVIQKELLRMPAISTMDAENIFLYIGGVSGSIFFRVSLVLIFLAILDFAFQKYQFEESIKMTKQEIKEESKMTEGNPEIKSRIRSAQRQIAKKRMMADVPKADVIITNPTHIAIALGYEAGMSAPRVLAKGERLIAEKIKEIAREHDIPIVEDKPLAQAIYREVEIGDVIPPDFYRAAAEILAYVMKIGKLKGNNWGV